jgi:hypothetical protein
VRQPDLIYFIHVTLSVHTWIQSANPKETTEKRRLNVFAEKEVPNRKYHW